MNLIDKDVLVEEINKQISNGKFKCQQSQENNDYESYVAWSEHVVACGKILSFINTLEVKEMNLEEEIDSYFNTSIRKNIQANDNVTLFMQVRKVAKHFFKLGLNANKTYNQK